MEPITREDLFMQHQFDRLINEIKELKREISLISKAGEPKVAEAPIRRKKNDFVRNDKPS